MIWNTAPSLEGIAAIGQGTAVAHLGIVITEIGDDYLVAEMAVDHKTVQPMRMLHGGVSCVLSETLGSIAGMLCVPKPGEDFVVGTEINASHLRAVPEGEKVTARVSPVRLGRRVQVWQTEIKDEAGRLVCLSRLTCQVMEGG